jgi:hypothetical protein
VTRACSTAVEQGEKPEESEMKLRKMFGTSFAMAVMLTALAACQRQEGPAEKAGKSVDKAVEKVGDQIEKAGDSIQDATQRDKK